jgi:Zn finger protein HypA/HybF involved in hydrogenase expression
MSDQTSKLTEAGMDACPASSPAVSGEHWRFCLQCGHELINEKCKLRCPRCHYFMSCSDFDSAG